MPIEGEYERSPSDWAADQAELYERTNGAEGDTLQGRPIIVIHTKGRKSGKVRKTPLMKVQHGDEYAVVASQGGAPKHPVWYLNILADPHVVLQDGAETRDYTARVAEGDEKAQWWARAVETWPAYDEYQAKTDRQIPLVVLTPTS
jgi:deazaflavin-dependent oxidoreductase (nitroreductase family)